MRTDHSSLTGLRTICTAATRPPCAPARAVRYPSAATSRSAMSSGNPKRRATPGSGLFVGFLAPEAAGQRNAKLGYVFAVAAACISGVSIFVNSLGVRAFADPVVYTTLKDGLVGLILLV